MELYTNWIQLIASKYTKINNQITSLVVKSIEFDEHARVKYFNFNLNGAVDFQAWGFQTGSYRTSLNYCKVNNGKDRWERVVRFGTCFTQGRSWMPEYHSLVLVMKKICNEANIDDSDTGGADLFEMLLKICWLGQFEGIPDDLREGFLQKDLTFSNEMEFGSWNYKLTKEERELYLSRDKIVPKSISPFVTKFESWKGRQTRYVDSELKRDVK